MAQAYTKKGRNYEIMGAFLSISNINSIINPDAVPKIRYGQWTGNKELLNVGLIVIEIFANSTHNCNHR